MLTVFYIMCFFTSGGTAAVARGKMSNSAKLKPYFEKISFKNMSIYPHLCSKENKQPNGITNWCDVDL